jgi:hypothetical protein
MNTANEACETIKDAFEKYRVIQNFDTILKEVIEEIIWSRKCK